MEMIGPESDKIGTLDVARRIWTTIVNELIFCILTYWRRAIVDSWGVSNGIVHGQPVI